MSDSFLFTSESVSEGHPDKVCDRISDAVVDAYLGADAGARVIKVEREGGDFARHYDRFANGQSAYFVWLNRGKESLTADIKDPEDQALSA